MSHGRRTGVVTVALLLLVAAATSTAEDTIEIKNIIPGEELGLTVDGIKGTDTVNDAPQLLMESAADVIRVTVDFDSGTDGDIIAFQKGRMVGITPSGWTPRDDTVTIDMKEEQAIGLVVWYLVERNSSMFNRAMQSAALAGQAWHDERMGLTLASVDEKDVSGQREAKSSLKVSYEDGKSGYDDCDRLVEHFPPEPGKVNVYFVEEVSYGSGSGFATTNGVWCGDSGGNVVILGKDARCDLMAHEFGHTLLLNHVSPPSFDDRNMMWSISTRRRFFTEGQLSVAHFVEGSSINKTYGLRYGERMHPCATPTNCQALDLRLWTE